MSSINVNNDIHVHVQYMYMHVYVHVHVHVHNTVLLGKTNCCFRVGGALVVQKN